MCSLKPVIEEKIYFLCHHKYSDRKFRNAKYHYPKTRIKDLGCMKIGQLEFQMDPLCLLVLTPSIHRDDF
jgi:hypothetical protein